MDATTRSPLALADSIAGYHCGAPAAVAGTITGVESRTTRQQRAWCTATLLAASGQLIEVVALPMAYAPYHAEHGALTVGAQLTVAGHVDLRLDTPRLMADLLLAGAPTTD